MIAIDRYIGSFTGGACVPAGGGVPEISGILCVVVNIIDYLLTIAAAVAFIMIVVGGIQYMISGGDEKAITASKATLTYAVLGLIIILGAVLIVNSVLATLIQ